MPRGSFLFAVQPNLVRPAAASGRNLGVSLSNTHYPERTLTVTTGRKGRRGSAALVISFNEDFTSFLGDPVRFIYITRLPWWAWLCDFRPYPPFCCFFFAFVFGLLDDIAMVLAEPTSCHVLLNEPPSLSLFPLHFLFPPFDRHRGPHLHPQDFPRAILKLSALKFTPWWIRI